jgi:hypothetical protein
MKRTVFECLFDRYAAAVNGFLLLFIKEQDKRDVVIVKVFEEIFASASGDCIEVNLKTLLKAATRHLIKERIVTREKLVTFLKRMQRKTHAEDVLLSDVLSNGGQMNIKDSSGSYQQITDEQSFVIDRTTIGS